jgi:DNA-binding FadR family transcriptional regulator
MKNRRKPVFFRQSEGEEVKSEMQWLHKRLVQDLGLAICGHEIPTRTIVKTEEFEAQYGVSRSVVRETVRVLESLGLVSSTRRVGVQILPPASWNLYDPQIIKWRLATSDRITQLRSLTELRVAVEPEAARLAAIRSPLTNTVELVDLARRMRILGEAGDRDSFLLLDVEFHRLILKSSGNEMFSKLDSLVEQVLTGRTHYGLMPTHPHEEALQLHINVAKAIQRGSPDTAHRTMLSIMHRTLQEMSEFWQAGN